MDQEKKYIVVQSFKDGKCLCLARFSRTDGYFWTKSHYAAKGFTLAGAERMVSSLVKKGFQKSIFGLPGVECMKIGSIRFLEHFRS